VVEVALALPLVLGLLLGTLALSRLIQAQTAVVAVAHEAARAGALANSAEDAISQMQARVERVALGLGLDPTAMVLRWDVSSFGAEPGQVVASVSYAVDLHDLPLAGWAPAPVVRSEHVEWVDPFRSGIGLLESAAR
jgi:Flp pilus assembly protein TadG